MECYLFRMPTKGEAIRTACQPIANMAPLFKYFNLLIINNLIIKKQIGELLCLIVKGLELYLKRKLYRSYSL
jgi:hypothetical protein